MTWTELNLSSKNQNGLIGRVLKNDIFPIIADMYIMLLDSFCLQLHSSNWFAWPIFQSFTLCSGIVMILLLALVLMKVLERMI